jgi:GNAT superfamily N-acetyltransferase
MQEEIVIREAQATDIAEIVRHRRRMHEDIGELDARALDAMQASTSTFLEQAIPAGIFRGWLAQTSAGHVVAGGGMMIVPWLSRPADPKPRRAWILNVYTDPEYRRRGIPRRLMQTMIEWCRQAGFQSVSLHSSDEGRPLYESLGFKATEEMKLVLRAVKASWSPRSEEGSLRTGQGALDLMPAPAPAPARRYNKQASPALVR